MKLKLLCSAVLSAVIYSGQLLAQQGAVESYADESMWVASPAEIMRLRKTIQGQAAAQNSPVGEPYPEVVATDILDIDATFDLSLEPGERAPRIYLSRGQTTAVQFIDSHGNHWPIRKISSWLHGSIEIERALEGLTPSTSSSAGEDGEEDVMAESGFDPRDPQAGSFTVTALKHGVAGNATIYLLGQRQPIGVMFIAKQEVFHREATIRIGGAGPNSTYAQLFKGGVAAAGAKNDPDLTNALHGVSPAGSTQLVMEGANGKAWVKGDRIYVQTDIALYAPQIYAVAPSAGRYKAYKIEKTTRAEGTNAAGQTVKIRFLRSPAASMAGNM